MQDSTKESEGWASAIAVAVESTKVDPMPMSFLVPTLLLGLTNFNVASAWRVWPVGTSYE